MNDIAVFKTFSMSVFQAENSFLMTRSSLCLLAFYLDIFSLPFALPSRERSFVMRGVRAECTPHTQPEEYQGEHSWEQLPKCQNCSTSRYSLTWQVLFQVGRPGSASEQSLWEGWAGWYPARWGWSAECPGRRCCRVTPPLDQPTPVESPLVAPEIRHSAPQVKTS